MKKLIIFLFVSLSLVACSGSKIKPASPAILYSEYQNTFSSKHVNIPLDGCFDAVKASAVVVPGESNPSSNGQINVCMEVKKIKDLPMKYYTQDSGEIVLQILNKDGAVLETMRCYQELCTIKKGSIGTALGQTGELPLATAENLMKQIKYVRLVNMNAAAE